MTANMNVLLAQEMLKFTPVSGKFDVDAIAAAIGGVGFSFRDAADPATFVMSSDAESRDAFEARRRADPTSPFPYVPLAEVYPEKVLVWPIVNDAQSRDLSRQLLEWLTASYDCRITNDSGADVADLPEPPSGQG